MGNSKYKDKEEHITFKACHEPNVKFMLQHNGLGTLSQFNMWVKECGYP